MQKKKIKCIRNLTDFHDIILALSCVVAQLLKLSRTQVIDSRTSCLIKSSSFFFRMFFYNRFTSLFRENGWCWFLDKKKYISFLDLERGFHYNLLFKEIFKLNIVFDTNENLFQNKFIALYKNNLMYSIFKWKYLFVFLPYWIWTVALFWYIFFSIRKNCVCETARTIIWCIEICNSSTIL